MQLTLYNEILSNAEAQDISVAEPGIGMLATKIAATIIVVTLVLLVKKIYIYRTGGWLFQKKQS